MAGRKKTDATRQAIVRAAEEVFAHADFHEVLTDDIAARAGIGKGTLYRYFRSKEELYLAAIGEGLAELHATVTQVLQEPSPLPQTVARLARTLIGYFWHKRDFFVMLHRLEPKLKEHERAEWQARRSAIVQMLSELIERAGRRGEVARVNPRLATEAFLGMVRSVCVYRHESDHPDAVADTVTRLFLFGLQTQRADRRAARSPAALERSRG
jgi:AcrR family transcriptional regulator